MNKSQIFTKAHQIARKTVKIVGDYIIAFRLALKGVYDEIKNNNKNEKTFKLDMASKIHETEKALLVRVFANYKRSGGYVEVWLPKSGVISFEGSTLELTGWALWMAKKKVAECLNGIPARVRFA